MNAPKQPCVREGCQAMSRSRFPCEVCCLYLCSEHREEPSHNCESLSPVSVPQTTSKKKQKDGSRRQEEFDQSIVLLSGGRYVILVQV